VADYQAVFAVGDAIARHLNNNYDPALVGFPCTFKLVSSSEIANEDQTKLDKIVSLYLHRITTDENFRNVSRLQNSPRDQPVLYLDLHYLLSYWDASAEGAEAEQKILIWTMQQLQSHPILDTSILSLSSAAPGWDKTDSVQLVPADISLQDILDIWDGLGPKYRLTVSYIVRVVRVDRAITPGMPVVATRFTVQNNGVPS
jgi:Pvc16 N-terminal domain